jgi:hypothetical protein
VHPRIGCGGGARRLSARRFQVALPSREGPAGQPPPPGLVHGEREVAGAGTQHCPTHPDWLVYKEGSLLFGVLDVTVPTAVF